ncbi:MAG: hypothetical protein IJ068_01660 [Bacilli bacterium]|nr:hypothetical protein [Bacilli bacterium]
MYNTIKNNVIEVSLIEGIANVTYPRFGDEEPITFKEPRFKNVIYTDGDVKVVDEFTINSINPVPLEAKLDELNLIKDVYHLDSSIDEILLKRVVIENATYFINLDFQRKWVELARIHGFFWQLQDLQVNVVRPISKETRQRIKQTLNSINGQKLKNDASIFDALFRKPVTFKVEYEESLDKIYTLKKN